MLYSFLVDVLHQLQAELSNESSRALGVIINLAQVRGLVPYLVGGPVRDLLLGRRPIIDLDIVVEGDAVTLARTAGRALRLRPTVHDRFGTATLRNRDVNVDLVTARKERYAAPGALPQVAPSTLDDDLRRRDFTVHAMALALSGPDAGAIVDPTGGRADLERRVLRVIHDASFIDDPTRILRAARYSARLQFTLEPHTLELAVRDVGGIATLTGTRIRHEVERMLAEAEPERALAAASELGVWATIHPDFAMPGHVLAAFSGIEAAVSTNERDDIGWAIIGAGLTPTVAEALAKRLALPARQRAATIGGATLANDAALAGRPASSVARAAEAHPAPAVWGAALASPIDPVRVALLRYLHEIRYMRAELDAAALVAAGVPKGPRMGRLLTALLDAKRDGLVIDRGDELAFVKRKLDFEKESTG